MLFNDHPFGTFDAWSGRRPPHQSRRLRVRRLLLVFPEQRSYRCTTLNGVMCQSATSRQLEISEAVNRGGRRSRKASSAIAIGDAPTTIDPDTRGSNLLPPR